MDKLTIVVIIILIYLFLHNFNVEHFYQIPKRNLLGPSINGQLTTNNGKFNKNIYNMDPKIYNLNNGFLIASSYNHLIMDNFNNNTKKSLALASIKEILNDTKILLNKYNTQIAFDYTNVTELKQNNEDFKPILNLILNSINTVGKKYYSLKPYELERFKIYKNNNMFLFNVELLCDVTNYDDDIIKTKISDYSKINNYDVLTTEEPLKIKLILHFFINNVNNLDMNIYIDNLSAILNK